MTRNLPFRERLGQQPDSAISCAHCMLGRMILNLWMSEEPKNSAYKSTPLIYVRKIFEKQSFPNFSSHTVNFFSLSKFVYFAICLAILIPMQVPIDSDRKMQGKQNIQSILRFLMATPNHSKSEKQSVKWPLLIYIYMRGELILTASTDRLYNECSKIADHIIREHEFCSFICSLDSWLCFFLVSARSRKLPEGELWGALRKGQPSPSIS